MEQDAARLVLLLHGCEVTYPARRTIVNHNDLLRLKVANLASVEALFAG